MDPAPAGCRHLRPERGAQGEDVKRPDDDDRLAWWEIAIPLAGALLGLLGSIIAPGPWFGPGF